MVTNISTMTASTGGSTTLTQRLAVQSMVSLETGSQISAVTSTKIIPKNTLVVSQSIGNFDVFGHSKPTNRIVTTTTNSVNTLHTTIYPPLPTHLIFEAQSNESSVKLYLVLLIVFVTVLLLVCCFYAFKSLVLKRQLVQLDSLHSSRSRLRAASLEKGSLGPIMFEGKSYASPISKHSLISLAQQGPSFRLSKLMRAPSFAETVLSFGTADTETGSIRDDSSWKI